MSMMRTIMRGIVRKSMNGPAKKNVNAVGNTRAGMHQKAENEFHRTAAMSSGPEASGAVIESEISDELEAMIPEENNDCVIEISGEEAVIAADPDLAEKSAEIQTSDESDPDFSAEHQMSADWRGVRIPVLEPLTGGTQCEPRELVYDRGDGVVRMIPDPLGILSDEGLSPFFPEMKNPSANVSGQGNS